MDTSFEEPCDTIVSSNQSETIQLTETSIEIYNDLFEGKNVRLYGTFDKPLFMMKDVLIVLGISYSPSDVLNKYKLRDEKYYTQTVINRGRKKDTVNLLTERGVYEILFRTNSKIANQFKDFVYELLHQFRTKQLLNVSEKLQQLENENQKLAIQLSKTVKHGYIYKITSKDPEDPFVYYGSTSKNINERWEEHKNEMRSYMKKNKFFRYVLDKGIQEFECYKLEDVYYTDEVDLLKREQHYKDLHNPNFCLNTRNPISKKEKKIEYIKQR